MFIGKLCADPVYKGLFTDQLQAMVSFLGANPDYSGIRSIEVDYNLIEVIHNLFRTFLSPTQCDSLSVYPGCEKFLLRVNRVSGFTGWDDPGFPEILSGLRVSVTGFYLGSTGAGAVRQAVMCQVFVQLHVSFQIFMNF